MRDYIRAGVVTPTLPLKPCTLVFGEVREF
jgi:hypothetical protein